MKIRIWYFSGTGQSKKLASKTADYLKVNQVEVRDITGYEQRASIQEQVNCDQIILIFPIYGSEAPAQLVESLKSLKGNKVPIMLVALWGKCHKKEALYHVSQILRKGDFIVNGGAEIVATHSYLSETYPIEFKLEEAHTYFTYINRRLGRKEEVYFTKQKRPFIERIMCSFPEGTFPRIATRLTLDETLCKQCGVCIKACPNKAIGEDYQINEKQCSRCLSCMTKCPYKARQVRVLPLAQRLLKVHGNKVYTNSYYE